MMPRPNDIIKSREHDHKRCHEHTVVHSGSCDRCSSWPETEEKDYDAKDDAECIVDDTKDPRDTERSPNEGASLGAVRGQLVLRADLARAAAPKEETFDEDVGGVEGGDRERDDVVKSSNRADIDETEDHAEDGSDEDCENGN